MKLLRYLKEDTSMLTVDINYTKLSFEDLVDLIRSSYDVAFNNEHHLYRGINNDIDYMYVNPKLVTRQSANARYNYYTELLDSFKSWQDYPKRSKSLICSTSVKVASGYTYTATYPYIVLPKNGAKLGVTPSHDLWWSFNWLKDIGINDLDDLNQELHVIIKAIFKVNDGLNIVQRCKMIDKKLIDSLDKDTDLRLDDYSALYRYFKDLNYDNLYDYLDHLMNSRLSGFKVTTIDKLDSFEFSLNEHGHEIWTDSDCVLFKDDGTINKLRSIIS